MTGGAVCLCSHVVIVVLIALCASHVVLRGLNISSCNVCRTINKVINFLSFVGNILDANASEFLAFRLNAKGVRGLGQAFSALLASRVVLTLFVMFLTRANKA